MQDSIEDRIRSIKEVQPDMIDASMLAEAARVNDGTTVSLSTLMQELEGYSGKLLIRIPRELHKALAQEAKANGVSLNQYAVYKLSKA